MGNRTEANDMASSLAASSEQDSAEQRPHMRKEAMTLSLEQGLASHFAFCEWAQMVGSGICSSALSREGSPLIQSISMHHLFCHLYEVLSFVRHYTGYRGHRDERHSPSSQGVRTLKGKRAYNVV